MRRLKIILGLCLLLPWAAAAQEQIPEFNAGLADSLEALRDPRGEMTVIGDVLSGSNIANQMHTVPGEIAWPDACALNDAETREKDLLAAHIAAALAGSAEHLAAFLENVPRSCQRRELNYYRASASALGVTP